MKFSERKFNSPNICERKRKSYDDDDDDDDSRVAYPLWNNWILIITYWALLEL